MKKYLFILLITFGVYSIGSGQVCPAPTALSNSNVTGTTAVLSWFSGGGPSQWEIIVTTPQAPEPTTSSAGTFSGISSPFVATGLTPCTNYKWYVRSVCAPGETSAWSGPFHFTTTSGFSCNTTIAGNMVLLSVTGTPNMTYTYTVTPNLIGGTQAITANSNGYVQAHLNLPSGTYVVTVQDVSGCSCSSVVNVQQPSFFVNISATLDMPTSALMANVTGGTAPYQYQWSLNGAPIQQATNDTLTIMGQPGLYQVTVTDATGQTAVNTITIQGAAVNAVNDAITVYPGSNGITVSSASVLANDFINAVPVNPNNHPNIIFSPVNLPSGLSLNPNGTINVLPGTAPGTYTLTYSICETQIPTSCSTATVTVTVANEGFLLNAFLDLNNNGTQDSGEVNFSFGQFHYELNNSGNVNSVVSSNGMYYLQESGAANSYDFSFSVGANYSTYYTLATPPYANITYVAGSGVAIYNFAVTQLPYTDAFVVVEPSGAPPRPGFMYVNRIFYRNSGNQTIPSGRLAFTKDDAVSIVSVSQSGTVNNATGFTYDFTNLLPNESRSVLVTMQVPAIPTVALGNRLTNSAVLTSITNDASAGNNSSILAQTIVGSYDPNDKTEHHGGKILHAAFTSNDYLTYTIQFENTGTYQAENVRINDLLDAQLDETTLKMVAGSHPYNLVIAGNNLNWNFNGIDLPPSGKGYVTFQIKPKAGYALGDIIPNTARIYFDFNPAIVTNTFTTEFVNSLSVDEFDSTAFTLYPNPADSIVTIALKNNANTIDRLDVIDSTGKTVWSKSVNQPFVVVDLSSLASGLYFIQLKSGNQKKTMKIIKK